MSGDTMAEIVLVLADKIERLAQESGLHYKESVAIREELEASKKECQELRDALAEAVRGLRDRGGEASVDSCGLNDNLTLHIPTLHRGLTEKGIGMHGSPIEDRLSYAIECASQYLRQQRTTQDG